MLKKILVLSALHLLCRQGRQQAVKKAGGTEVYNISDCLAESQSTLGGMMQVTRLSSQQLGFEVQRK